MTKEIKVSGHLEVIKGIYHMKISWVSAEGKRQRKSKSTNLPERGNKKRAQDMLIDFQREQEAELVAPLLRKLVYKWNGDRFVIE